MRTRRILRCVSLCQVHKRRADPLSVAKRSDLMARVRSTRNASTELRLLMLLRAHRIRGWRRGSRLPGCPDFVFPSRKVAVFVDGCFWHGCPTHYRSPQGARIYWAEKVARNRRRDREVTKTLRARGWLVLRIWEHSLRGSASNRVMQRIASTLAAASTRS